MSVVLVVGEFALGWGFHNLALVWFFEVIIVEYPFALAELIVVFPAVDFVVGGGTAGIGVAFRAAVFQDAFLIDDDEGVFLVAVFEVVEEPLFGQQA